MAFGPHVVKFSDGCLKATSGFNWYSNFIFLVLLFAFKKKSFNDFPFKVKAAFNEETRCYEIRTASRCRQHEEVFICYGPHDNQRLLLEYGFVSTRNPHACVYVSEG